MKKSLIFVLVMVLLMVMISPALAGNGNRGGGGGRGNGQGRNGSANNQYRHDTAGTGYGWQYGNNVITGVITDIDVDSLLVTLLVFGGKDVSLYGMEKEVKIDSSTRVLSKKNGEIIAITFEGINEGDAASIAIGSDGIADRITVGVDCPNIP